MTSATSRLSSLLMTLGRIFPAMGLAPPGTLYRSTFSSSHSTGFTSWPALKTPLMLYCTPQRTQHPFLDGQVLEPALQRGDEAQVLDHVLLSDVPDADLLPVAVGDVVPELLFQQEDAERRVQDGPVTHVRERCLRLVEPVVEWEVVFWLASPLVCRVLGVLPGFHAGEAGPGGPPPSFLSSGFFCSSWCLAIACRMVTASTPSQTILRTDHEITDMMMMTRGAGDWMPRTAFEQVPSRPKHTRIMKPTRPWRPILAWKA